MLGLKVAGVCLEDKWMLADTFHALLRLPEFVFPTLHTIVRSLVLKAFQNSLVFDGDLHEFLPTEVAIHALLA